MFDRIIRDHVQWAFENADTVPKTTSQDYYLTHKGGKHTPKDIVRLAYQYAYGTELGSFDVGAANRLLTGLGYQVLRTDDQTNYWVFPRQSGPISDCGRP